MKDLAATLKKAPAQVSQWLNHVRTISEASAREIETRCKRPQGWMDTPSGALQLTSRVAERQAEYSDWPLSKGLLARIRRLSRENLARLEKSIEFRVDELLEHEHGAASGKRHGHVRPPARIYAWPTGMRVPLEGDAPPI